MKKPGKNSWLIILMIISEIMLAGLLIQWLRSEWLDKKEFLQKDINVKFNESVNQAIDSMLIKHLIQPALNDSTVRVSHTNSRNSTLRKKPVFNDYDSIEKNLLLRSVKIIIDKTEDSTGQRRQFPHLVTLVPDTILLQRMFESNLDQLVHGLGIRWIFDSKKVIRHPQGSAMYFISNSLGNPFSAEIVHYQNTVLKGILPQILFALVLMTFTAAAFLLTFRSLKKMEALNTMRNDFISNISHELKTPVATVTVALEALKSFDRLKDPGKSYEYMEIAFNEMKRLDKLITQILNTSILDDQNRYLQKEETDIVSLTNEVLNSMQIRFAQLQAKVKFETNCTTCTLNLDKLHFQGVLSNLLDNSLKYCDGIPDILIRLEQNTTTVTLTIRDNGPGIPDQYINKVFDKFFRVPKGNTHDVKGYGLGLSFAYQVMKHHSGSIKVRNHKEGGCVFTLLFPKIQK
jgi:signal transduction histidine kinase